MGSISELEPKCVLSYFEEITKIPRGTGYEREISDYLVSFADKRGLIAYRDKLNNVTILKPASEGMEEKETVILQAHTDMVCVADAGNDIDFTNSPIEAYIDGKYIRGKGTTLGADDGIGVAMILALLNSGDIKHPMIEAVFTTGEEGGMDGAAAYDYSKLSGKKMINLDTEEENHIVVGCAGGCHVRLSGKCKKEKRDGVIYEVTVGGLKGGHSGTEIGNVRANANVLLGRILYEASVVSEVSLCSFEGGEKDNAICNHAKATVVVKKKTLKEFEKCIERFREIFKAEYCNTDKGVHVKLKEKSKDKTETLSDNDFKKIIGLVLNAPNGVDCYDAPGGEVISSANVGMVHVRPKSFTIGLSLRGNLDSLLDNLVDRVSLLAQFFGVEMSVSGHYPPWMKSESCDFAERIARLYREKYGREIEIITIHAGLECALFAKKIENIDIVSIGPDILGAHTSDERLDIESVGRLWDLLLDILKE